jgi:hypothetical protein
MHSAILEMLTKAYLGLQFPVDDLRGLYGAATPLELLAIEKIHQQLVAAKADLNRLMSAVAQGETHAQKT